MGTTTRYAVRNRLRGRFGHRLRVPLFCGNVRDLNPIEAAVVVVMCALFLASGLWEAGGVWLLLVASLELGE